MDKLVVGSYAPAICADGARCRGGSLSTASNNAVLGRTGNGGGGRDRMSGAFGLSLNTEGERDDGSNVTVRPVGLDLNTETLQADTWP